ncbi:hypothetical protein [Rhizobium giardinii]|uniref:Uncharacterized protein n=1 Tax=Rhizobium giardinii TaxID=56731 RepID=A0A7W8UAH7_9HYPH|nr:hypothetical protein [Rhizobium giardinii]MBB5535825.1 hypothetical protein [Rhizobium giardinii]
MNKLLIAKSVLAMSASLSQILGVNLTARCGRPANSLERPRVATPLLLLAFDDCLSDLLAPFKTAHTFSDNFGTPSKHYNPFEIRC